MAFPQIEDVTGTGDSTPSDTDQAASLPATVNAGELLLANIYVTGGADTTIANVDDTTGDSWTQLDFSSPTGDAAALYAKVADGDEDGANLEFDTTTGSTAVAVAVQILRISGWGGTIATDIDVSTANSGLDANPDSNSVTAGWGSDDNLFLHIGGAGNDGGTITSAPSGWGTPVNQVAGGGTDDDATAFYVPLESTNATENPGTSTLSETEFWQAWTLVIEPESAAPEHTAAQVVAIQIGL